MTYLVAVAELARLQQGRVRGGVVLNRVTQSRARLYEDSYFYVIA